MTKKILLIDDSKTQLSTLKILFKRAGFDVETASDGVEGYQKIFEIAPDIVVSDIMMPNLNGYQLCRLIKDNSLTKDIPIILLTVLEQKIDKFWSNKSGADVFLLKSAEIENIIATINQLIEEKPVNDETKEKIKKHSYSQGVIQEELNHILDGALMQASVLNEFRLLAMHLEDDAQMSKNLFELLSSILNYDLVLLILSPVGTIDKKVFAGSCLNLDDNTLQSAIQKSVQSVFGEDVEYSAVKVYENWCGLEKLDDSMLENSYIHQIKHGDNVVGAVCFFGMPGKEMCSQKFFHTLLKEIDLLVTVQTLYDQNKFLSWTDSLTGLFNRRYLMETLEREYERSKRYKSQLSIALMDIDYFKRINDTYGHQAGDFILKEVTRIIKQTLRKSDIVFRYGGEEVLAIMPETEKEKAFIALERIRKIIENYEFRYQENIIKTSISIGITDTACKAATLEMFIEHSDKAMYEAKQTGRNRIKLYDE